MTDWLKKLEEVRRDREQHINSAQYQKNVITNAHEDGGLSYAVIAKAVGLSRIQVIRIVRDSRKES